METLSHTCLHKKPAMVDALSRAGQFAHLRPREIEDALGELYDPLIRSRIAGEPIEAYAENAVPRDFASLWGQELLTEEVYRATAAQWVAVTLGVTCCLCLDVSYEQAGLLDEGFAPFFCPTYLRTGNPDRPAAKGPLPFCHKCGTALANWTWREGGLRNSSRAAPDEVLFAAAAWLVTNRTFRERVQENGYRLGELRFDPRRVQSWGRRALATRTRTCERCGGKRSIRAKTCRTCFMEDAPAAAQARWDRRRAALAADAPKASPLAHVELGPGRN